MIRRCLVDLMCRGEIGLVRKFAALLKLSGYLVTGLFLFRPGVSDKVAAMFAGHPRALNALEAGGMMGGDVYNLLP